MKNYSTQVNTLPFTTSNSPDLSTLALLKKQIAIGQNNGRDPLFHALDTSSESGNSRLEPNVWEFSFA